MDENTDNKKNRSGPVTHAETAGAGRFDLKWFLFSLKGRVGRKHFWLFNLAVFVMFLAYCSIIGINMMKDDDRSIFFYLVVLWPAFAVQVKRWHDIDKSAWWILINFIPLIGSFWALAETGFKGSTQGENSYGEASL